MKSKFVFNGFVLFISLQLSAQELTLKLSQHPNKKAVIVAVHGVRKDTLGTIELDQNGKGTLAYNNKQSQAGLVNLTISDKAYLSYDFVLSPTENPTLICDMEYVYAQNTKILDSPENDGLNRWFDNTTQFKQRLALNLELSKLYKPDEPFLKKLEAEKQTTQVQLQMLTDTINKSKLFAGKYMQFKLAQEEKLAKVWESNEQRTIAKNYFTQIDFDALYGSSMWFAIINSCMEAYVKESPFHETFGSAIASNLKRIKNEQVYVDLIDAAISITEKFSWSKDQDEIVEFIVNDNRIKNPTGKLQKIIQLYALSNGKKAPNLQVTQIMGTKSKTVILNTATLNSKYSLLLFYQSDCGHCETAIDELKNNYKDTVQKGIKIVSIAGDTNQEKYSKTASTFPWTDKYCDVEGMNGINFKNYAVLGAPTIYLLNNKGIVLSKMATVKEVLDFVNKK